MDRKEALFLYWLFLAGVLAAIFVALIPDQVYLTPSGLQFLLWSGIAFIVLGLLGLPFYFSWGRPLLKVCNRCGMPLDNRDALHSPRKHRRLYHEGFKCGLCGMPMPDLNYHDPNDPDHSGEAPLREHYKREHPNVKEVRMVKD